MSSNRRRMKRQDALEREFHQQEWLDPSVRGGWDLGHVGADLSDDDFGGVLPDARNALQELTGSRKGGDLLVATWRGKAPHPDAATPGRGLRACRFPPGWSKRNATRCVRTDSAKASMDATSRASASEGCRRRTRQPLWGRLRRLCDTAVPSKSCLVRRC